MEKPKDDTRVLLPETVAVTVGGKSYQIGKLTLSQTIRLVRVVSRALAKFSTEDRQKLAEGGNNVDDVLSFFDIVDERITEEILQILLPASHRWEVSEVGLNELTEIVLAVIRTNDFRKIWGNVQAVMQEIQKQASSPLSAESPAPSRVIH